jgi:uncharacterized membrane protein
MTKRRSSAGRSQNRPAVSTPNNHEANHHSRVVELSQQSIEIRRGPLPDAAELAQYEHILPGSADRILTMAEEQLAHRIDIENKVIAGDTYRADKGMKYGAILLGLTIICSTIVGVTGNEIAASALAAGGGATSLSTIWANWQRRRERESRGKP